jgi:hypothetical protein
MAIMPTRLSVQVPEGLPKKLAELAGSSKKMGDYLTVLIEKLYADMAEGLHVEEINPVLSPTLPSNDMDMSFYYNELKKVDSYWSLGTTPWGDKIICHLTVGGVTRSAVGHSDDQALYKTYTMFKLPLPVTMCVENNSVETVYAKNLGSEG